MYKAIFSRKAEKSFLDLPTKEAGKVKDTIEKLERNPRTYGTVKLREAPVAKYRFRVVNYRFLFDINDKEKVIEVLDVRKRSERAYK